MYRGAPGTWTRLNAYVEKLSRPLKLYPRFSGDTRGYVTHVVRELLTDCTMSGGASRESMVHLDVRGALRVQLSVLAISVRTGSTTLIP